MNKIAKYLHYYSWFVLLGITGFFSGCASIPENMQVRSGASPTYQDDNVRFRATYYFRVLSFCGNSLATSDNVIETDSLYRFRMTGKASALSSKIHFESCILHKDIIDPFGSVVVYDTENNRFHVSSHTDIRRTASRDEMLKEIAGYLELVKEMPPIEEDSLNVDLEINRKTVLDLINDNLQEIKQLRAKSGGQGSGLGKTEHDKKQNGCNDGADSRYGFQILGPQGIRTYDPDQRLILSMSSSAKPLIATLKETASRMMPRPADNTRVLLLITREHLNVSRAEKALDSKLNNISSTPESIVRNVLGVFSGNDMVEGK